MRPHKKSKATETLEAKEEVLNALQQNVNVLDPIINNDNEYRDYLKRVYDDQDERTKQTLYHCHLAFWIGGLFTVAAIAFNVLIASTDYYHFLFALLAAITAGISKLFDVFHATLNKRLTEEDEKRRELFEMWKEECIKN